MRRGGGTGQQREAAAAVVQADLAHGGGRRHDGERRRPPLCHGHRRARRTPPPPFPLPPLADASGRRWRVLDRHAGGSSGAVVLVDDPQHLLHRRQRPPPGQHLRDPLPSKNHGAGTFLGTPTNDSDGASAGGNTCLNSGPTTGHYSQPSVPTIKGTEVWRRRQLHSHSYRLPEPFRDEVVVMVGCGDNGKDIALDLISVAKEVHLTTKSTEEATMPAMSKLLAKYANLHLRPQVKHLCEDGTLVFVDGSRVVALTAMYCTGYVYSFPFLDTDGMVTVDDNRVGPLFEHVFPPALAPSLSFVGVPRKVPAPWFFEGSGSRRRTLPPVEEMLRAVEEHYRARAAAGVPVKYTPSPARSVGEGRWRGWGRGSAARTAAAMAERQTASLAVVAPAAAVGEVRLDHRRRGLTLPSGSPPRLTPRAAAHASAHEREKERD
uniref:Flavin-containing monooxygenase n=1 Tax=Oryza meridionalis TaxID=40149 RepID=A0A0E0F4W5_9ORYZ